MNNKKCLLIVACTIMICLTAMNCNTKQNKNDINKRSRPQPGWKTIVFEQGILKISENGMVVIKPWQGELNKWNMRCNVTDYLVGTDGSIYLLTDDALESFNLKDGPKSLDTIIRFKTGQRYLQIIGKTVSGIWLMRPSVSIDKVWKGQVMQHYNYNDILRVKERNETSQIIREPYALYSGSIGGTVYLAMMYGRDDYGYLIYTPQDKKWKLHLLTRKHPPCPLVMTDNNILELYEGHNAFSLPWRSDVKLTGNQSVEGYYYKLKKNQYITAMARKGKTESVKVIRMPLKKILYEKSLNKHGMLGVYIHNNDIWLWDLGWVSKQEPIHWSLPVNLANENRGVQGNSGDIHDK